MPSLDAIIANTRQRLEAAPLSLGALERAASHRAPPRDFLAALQRSDVAVIAEVKRRSPSAGAINTTLDPVGLARAYETGGAAAISVLTDEVFFGGSIDDLAAVAPAVAIPVLRKDFVLQESQLLEARAAGAAAVLLIVRILEDRTLARLHEYALSLGLQTLIEAHTPDEVTRAVASGGKIIGINARDLDTFVIDVTAAWAMLAAVPADCVAVAESGMAFRADVERAATAGADAVLVGSALASSSSPAAAVQNLAGVSRRGR